MVASLQLEPAPEEVQGVLDVVDAGPRVRRDNGQCGAGREIEDHVELLVTRRCRDQHAGIPRVLGSLDGLRTGRMTFACASQEPRGQVQSTLASHGQAQRQSHEQGHQATKRALDHGAEIPGTGIRVSDHGRLTGHELKILANPGFVGRPLVGASRRSVVFDRDREPHLLAPDDALGEHRPGDVLE